MSVVAGSPASGEQLRFVAAARRVFAVSPAGEFKTCFLQPHPALTGRKEEEDSQGRALGEGQLNKQREQRERERESGGNRRGSDSPSVPRNLSKPIYPGPLALQALWVLSFVDR